MLVPLFVFSQNTVFGLRLTVLHANVFVVLYLCLAVKIKWLSFVYCAHANLANRDGLCHVQYCPSNRLTAWGKAVRS